MPTATARAMARRGSGEDRGEKKLNHPQGTLLWEYEQKNEGDIWEKEREEERGVLVKEGEGGI